jgi:hypothetical protein
MRCTLEAHAYKVRAIRYTPIEMYTHEVHAYEVHTHDTHVDELCSHERHVREMHAHETHDYEMHVQVHTHEVVSPFDARSWGTRP